MFLFKHLGDDAYNLYFVLNTEDIEKYIQNSFIDLKKNIAWKYVLWHLNIFTTMFIIQDFNHLQFSTLSLLSFLLYACTEKWGRTRDPFPTFFSFPPQTGKKLMDRSLKLLDKMRL